jgi:replicative DNA helicase
MNAADIDVFNQSIAKVNSEAVESKWKGKGKTFSQMIESYQQDFKKTHAFSLDFQSWLPKLAATVPPIFPGEMFTVVADTSGGKTAFLQNMISKIGMNLKTLFFQLELPDSLSVERFVAITQKQGIRDIAGLIKGGNSAQLGAALPNMITYSAQKFFIQDMEEIIGFEKPQCVIIDYMGLIRGTSKTRYERLSDIAEELKLMAMTLNVIVVAGVQIHRKQEGSSGEIFLHDARDSSSIENSAQVIFGLWREGENYEDMKIKVLKNKGPKDMIFPVSFNSKTLNIWSY